MAGKCARTEKYGRTRAGVREKPFLSAKDFPEIVRAAGNEHGLTGMLRSLEDLEREAIKLTLEATHYKIGQAADMLGISRKTLLEKRKKYGLI